MSQRITISSITANTPVDIYYCDSMSANCVYVSTVESFPYTFFVEPPYDQTNFLIKIIDNQSLQTSKFIYITPTPTPSITATKTPTPTQTTTIGLSPTPTTTVSPTNTKTQTPTPSITITQTPTITQTTTPLPTRTILPTTTPTQSITRTNTPTRTQTPTITPTMTSTPGISVHLISRNRFTDYYDSCKDVMTTSSFYTYISQANLIPVVGIKIYSTSVDGLLYNPVNGRNAWYKSKWGNDLYSVKIDNYGTILDFIICS